MKARSRRGHPLRPWIAAQMSWSSSRISRILTGKGKITPAEARRISELLKHDENEAAYYLAMTHWNWAEKRENRVRYWDEMERIRTARAEPKRKKKVPDLASADAAL